MEVKPVKVQAEIMWAFLDTPNELSGKYQVDLCNLSDSAVDVLKTMGINVRTKEGQPEKGRFITAKSSNFPIKTTDLDGNPITAKVGNGSKGVALIKPYQYPAGKGYKSGVMACIDKLVVTDLVVYDKSDAVTVDSDVL